tara:strand:+ start:119 stop:862 length:744 start_codon:yes stop_codon:yes gene_type:complete
MAIPSGLENLILQGKARFETYQTGLTEFNVIPVRAKEHIVITGFTFHPAAVVRYMDQSVTTQKATIQRIEFFDGENYSHFITKMTGGQADTEQRDLNETHQHNLYLVFHSDVGIMISVPQFGPVDLNAFRDTITGANGNSAAKVINQGTNPYLTTPQEIQYLTEGGSPGTQNIPMNKFVNGPNYSDSLSAGPYTNQETNQFQFTSEPTTCIYGGASSYSAIDPEDYRKNFYLNVQYVRVYEEGLDIR